MIIHLRGVWCKVAGTTSFPFCVVQFRSMKSRAGSASGCCVTRGPVANAASMTHSASLRDRRVAWGISLPGVPGLPQNGAPQNEASAGRPQLSRMLGSVWKTVGGAHSVRYSPGQTAGTKLVAQNH